MDMDVEEGAMLGPFHASLVPGQHLPHPAQERTATPGGSAWTCVGLTPQGLIPSNFKPKHLLCNISCHYIYMHNRDAFDLVINIWFFSYVDNQILTSCHVSVNYCCVNLQILCNVKVLTMSLSCVPISHYIYILHVDTTTISYLVRHYHFMSVIT